MHLRAARRALAGCLLVGQSTSALAQVAPDTIGTGRVDLLALERSAAGNALPMEWTSRAVRGQPLPMSEIIDAADGRFLRFSGSGSAGWFGRELRAPVPAAGGHLSWQWRVPVAPAAANVDVRSTDDAALRVFVVFARHSRFALVPRTIFYTVSTGQERSRNRQASALATILVATPAATRQWTTVNTNPFGDYRRLWGEDPTRIVAFGVMQDTDQTRQPAIGDLRNFIWRTPDAADP